MQATTEAAVLHGAHLLDVRAARLAAESFVQEVSTLPEADAAFVFKYLAEDDPTQREIWARLHDRMAGRHGGPLH
jgi:hypothetical protein